MAPPRNTSTSNKAPRSAPPKPPATRGMAVISQQLPTDTMETTGANVDLGLDSTLVLPHPPPATVNSSTDSTPPPPPPVYIPAPQSTQLMPTLNSRVNVHLEKFDGKSSALQFWTQFIAFITLQRMSEEDAIGVFQFYLTDVARDWFYQQSSAIRSSLSTLKSAFLNRFKPQVPFHFGVADLQQKSSETVDEYLNRVRKLAADSNMPDDCLTAMTMRGLKSNIARIVFPQRPATMEALRHMAVVAEMTVTMTQKEDSPDTSNAAVINAMTTMFQETIAAITSQRSLTARDAAIPPPLPPQTSYGPPVY